jgi:hypothetical protein
MEYALHAIARACVRRSFAITLGSHRVMHSRPLLIVLLAALTCAAPVAGAQRPASDPAWLAQQGTRALEERRFDEAFDLFSRAAALLPTEAALWYGVGLSAFMLGRNADADTALMRAVTLEPRFTDASALLGEVQYRRGHVREAIATYEAALAHAPDDPLFTDRLAEWRKDAQVSDRFYESRGAHFRVLFEGPADEALARRAVEMLEAAYWRVGGALGAYPTQTITVVLYTQEQFRDVTRSPEWSGGTYDGRIRIPVRGALGSPAELERVLVHEFVHAVVATLGGPRCRCGSTRGWPWCSSPAEWKPPGGSWPRRPPDPGWRICTAASGASGARRRPSRTPSARWRCDGCSTCAVRRP